MQNRLSKSEVLGASEICPLVSATFIFMALTWTKAPLVRYTEHLLVLEVTVPNERLQSTSKAVC